jgi:hypothetical protein
VNITPRIRSSAPDRWQAEFTGVTIAVGETRFRATTRSQCNIKSEGHITASDDTPDILRFADIEESKSRGKG